METLEEMFECPICMEEYKPNSVKKPLILPCGHTFCISCINKAFKNNRISCFLCKSSHVRNQPSNFAVNYILLSSIPSKVSTSEVCGKH